MGAEQEAAPLSDAQQIVLQDAEAARVAASGKPYTAGGSDTGGFDCSGYVIYVYNQAYGAKTLSRVTAEDLRTGGRFQAVDVPQPGDLVFFSSKPGGSTASHVAIIVDADRFIGSQSSNGVQYVKRDNSYWQPKVLSYGRFRAMSSPAAIIPMRAGTFPSTINPSP